MTRGALVRSVLVVAAAAALGAGCGRPEKKPAPADTARALLALHGLVGRQPEDRSEADRKKPEIGRASCRERV
jgi:hypothetical protein